MTNLKTWQEPASRYHKEIKPGVIVDVYDVLDAYEVKSHALAHAIKKLLMAGNRGTKDTLTDLGEAKQSIDREIEKLIPERSPDCPVCVALAGGEILGTEGQHDDHCGSCQDLITDFVRRAATVPDARPGESEPTTVPVCGCCGKEENIWRIDARWICESCMPDSTKELIMGSARS